MQGLVESSLGWQSQRVGIKWVCRAENSHSRNSSIVAQQSFHNNNNNINSFMRMALISHCCRVKCRGHGREAPTFLERLSVVVPERPVTSSVYMDWHSSGCL